MALEPEVRGQIPRPPSTTHVPVRQSGCKMGRTLIGNIDVVLATAQALPPEPFTCL